MRVGESPLPWMEVDLLLGTGGLGELSRFPFERGPGLVVVGEGRGGELPRLSLEDLSREAAVLSGCLVPDGVGAFVLDVALSTDVRTGVDEVDPEGNKMPLLEEASPDPLKSVTVVGTESDPIGWSLPLGTGGAGTSLESAVPVEPGEDRGESPPLGSASTLGVGDKEVSPVLSAGPTSRGGGGAAGAGVAVELRTPDLGSERKLYLLIVGKG